MNDFTAPLKISTTDAVNGSKSTGQHPPSPPPLRVITPDDFDDEPRGALAADPPLYPSEEFLAELESESQKLETATPQEILKWSVNRFGDKFTMATAFGCTSAMTVEPNGFCALRCMAGGGKWAWAVCAAFR